MNRPILMVMVLTFAPLAQACKWDRDTLAQEAKGAPDLVRVITGRFDRSPPLYYQMRLDRVRRELPAEPDALNLYDDAGVACDQLDRGDEAIAWMERKLARIRALAARGSDTKEHLYRYHANVGTFWVHRWLKQGAQTGRLDEVRKALDHIDKAIEINPNAHFGREKVQAQVMNWMLDTRTKKLDEFESGLLGESFYGDPQDVAGLVYLGNAWESVDIFEGLSALLKGRGDASMGYLAQLRSEELIAGGRRSLGPRGNEGILNALPMWAGTLEGGQLAIIRAEFKRLREEADRWHEARTRYMLDRLKAGRHPDTDPSFWSEYRDAGPPAIRSPFYITQKQMIELTAILLLGGFPTALAGFLVYRARRRRKALRVPPVAT